MSERVTMPALGESVTEGTVTQWLKSVGDSVEVDEPLLEVSTDKVDTEIPSPVAGTLQEILVEEDETVEVGADLCVVGEGAPASDSGRTEEPAQEPAEEPAGAPEDAVDTEAAEPTPSTELEEPPTKEEAKQASSGSSVSGGETVQMPALGESVTEGTVTQWLKSEGDEVEVDDPLLEVSTDKVDTEIPSPAAGTLTQILVHEDETVEVGADLCVIGGEVSGGAEPQSQPEPEPPGKEPTAEAPKQEPPTSGPRQDEERSRQPASQQAPAPAPEQPTRQAPTSEPRQSPTAGVEDPSSYVTPLVRKLAAEHGVDLSTLTGTGVGGRIRKQDVLDAAKAAEPEPEQAAAPPSPAASAPAEPAPAPSPGVTISPRRGTREKMSRLRKLIAQRMVESLQVSAQLTSVVEVDMTRIAATRARAKEEFLAREGVKLTFLPFIALATVETLKEFPQLNSAVEDEEIIYPDGEHLGIAVDTDRGLLVPVIKDAGDLNIAGIARKISDLAERTRTNKITPDELAGGTFTITNIGSNGSLLDTPIINQPQVGILGTGAIVKRPVVIDDEYGNESIAIRSMCYLVLTYDHRVVDGADAGRFLSALKRRLQESAFEV